MKVITVIALFSFFIGSSLASEHKKHHHEDISNAMSLNDGKKWEVDPMMRKNMQAIHMELEKTKELIKMNKVKRSDYLKLSDVISTSAQSIVANCKMEPKADSSFHVILEDLFSLSESLKDDKKTKSSIKHLTHALKRYSKYFNQNF